MSVGWLLGSSATQTRQFANEHGSAAVPARGVAGGGGEPRRAAWPGGRPARSCPAPPRAPPPSCHRFVTGTMGTPRCTLTAPGSRAGSASRYLVIYKKMQQEKAKWTENTGILYWPSHGSADLFFPVFLEVTNSWHTGPSEISITTNHVTLKRIKWLGCFLCLLIS